MTLPTNWVDGIGQQVDADFLNQLGIEGNANTNARPLAGTFASMPSAAHAGRLYYATDAGIVLRDTGSTWVVVANTGQRTYKLPSSSGWATTALGSATVVADKGGRLFTFPNADNTARIEYRTETIGANYTATACFDVAGASLNTQSQMFGLVLRNSSNGSVITFGYAFSANQIYLCAGRGTSGAFRSSTYRLTPISCAPAFPRWLRFRDDGTNRNFEFSANGIDWALFESNARTHFTTPDQVGWGGINPGAPSGIVGLRLCSFEVTTP